MTTTSGTSEGNPAKRRVNSPDEVAARAVTSYETIELPDGRTLAYNEFGDPDDIPILVCHGWPSSRVMAAALDDAARTAGVQLISPDRPGIGGSDPLPDRRLTDWPADAAALLDTLELDTVPVLGASGGGPYAAACAALIPERVAAVSFVASVGPPESREGSIRFLSSTARYLPPLARLLFWLNTRGIEDADALIEKRTADSPAVDAPLWSAPEGLALIQSAMVGRQNGTRPILTDLAIYARPWGFDLNDIDVPAACWHGTADENVPITMGKYIAARIEGCRVHVKNGEGHLSLSLNFADEYLTELCELADS